MAHVKIDHLHEDVACENDACENHLREDDGCANHLPGNDACGNYFCEDHVKIHPAQNVNIFCWTCS
jgi:hypothetical protein